MSAFGRTLTPRPRGKGKLVWEENWIRKVKREVSTTSLHQWPTFRPPFKTCYPQIPPTRLFFESTKAHSFRTYDWEAQRPWWIGFWMGTI